MKSEEKIKAILEARGCKPERIKCRKCKIQEICQSLQIKQYLESESQCWIDALEHILESEQE